MKKQNSVPAFTLFEVTVVLAIMSVLITIISVSLNRFNEQLKVSNDIQQELNEWYRFRSNLWKELYHADSMNLEKEEFNLYVGKKTVTYKIEDDFLFRKSNSEGWKTTGFTAEKIRVENQKDDLLYSFDFDWKGEEMTLSYLDHRTPKMKIDRYFETL